MIGTKNWYGGNIKLIFTTRYLIPLYHPVCNRGYEGADNCNRGIGGRQLQ